MSDLNEITVRIQFGEPYTADDVFSSVRRIGFSRTELLAAQPPAQAEQQYYYRVNECRSIDSKSDLCICWHDQGSGPLPDAKPGDETPSNWRAKPVTVSDAPCSKCGYNGPGYYQPATHPCVAQPEPSPDTELPVPVIKRGCEMAEGWSVTVEAFGKQVLTLSHNHLSGVPDLAPWESTIRGCANHLLSFIGAERLVYCCCGECTLAGVPISETAIGDTEQQRRDAAVAALVREAIYYPNGELRESADVWAIDFLRAEKIQ